MVKEVTFTKLPDAVQIVFVFLPDTPPATRAKHFSIDCLKFVCFLNFFIIIL